MPVLSLAGCYVRMQVRDSSVPVISVMSAALFVGQSAANMRLRPLQIHEKDDKNMARKFYIFSDGTHHRKDTAYTAEMYSSLNAMTLHEQPPRSKVLGMGSLAGHSLAHARSPSIAVRRRFGPGPRWETVPFCGDASVKRCVQIFHKTGPCTADPWQA